MSEAQKKPTRGGARANCGRKKRGAPVEVIDGRTIAGKEYAQELIDQLNSIDPQIMIDRELSVTLEPYEAPKDATADQREKIEKLEAERKARVETKRAAEKKFQKLSYEAQGWALLWFATRTALATRQYLYDKAKGKAVVTVNHLHDKPIEMNFNVSMAEVVRKVRERKQAYERSRN